MDVEKAKEETAAAAAAARAQCSHGHGHGVGRGKLAAALVAQSALVLLCLAVSFHSWVTARYPVKDKEKWQHQRATGIYLEWKTDSEKLLKFRTHWSQNMELKNESKIIFPCSGPYLMYLYYRAGGEDEHATSNTLSVSCNNHPLTTFHIKSLSHQRNASIFTFSKNDVVSVASDGHLVLLNVKHLHLSFYYMMDAQCFD